MAAQPTLPRPSSWLARRGLLLALVLLVLGPSLGACDEADPETSHLVVGITSDYRAGIDLDRLEIVMAVDDAVTAEESRPVAAGTFPAELHFMDVTPGTKLSLTLTGFLGADRRVVRHLVTEAGPAGPSRLVRLHLEQICDLLGSEPAPICDESASTCISGKCHSAFVPVEAHRPYSPDWPSGNKDVCKTGGAPEVIVGRGQSDFFTASDNEVTQVEAGPQGGHHIWIAARVKNLLRSGSITEVAGEIPSLGLSIMPLKVVFTFDTDEGGYCKIFGLRFQLDVGDDIGAMLGHPIRVFVTIIDADGDRGTDDHWFTLSDDIL